uniref:NADH dehydrogenase subunit 4L n=1 Tax=Vischeria sp. CAUP Q 202 TaxID=1805947 RepID=A0A140F2S5_9STRA|nr:NADH dehydrogenase subunit 4L [Vischeria punctata]AML60709.1 NADH dehydrogenase subunit 4L [Vischeria sp. CAUP Q 202]UUA03919.1 NADH dehydrogenase subunit 4L [Vischeria punctata]
MENYLILSTLLFFIGLFGIVLNRKNILIVLMSIELMLLGLNLNFVIFSIILDDMIGQIFALMVLCVAAAESAIGLAILVIYYRSKGNILIEQSHLMRG